MFSLVAKRLGRLNGLDGRLAAAATVLVAGFGATAFIGFLLGQLAVASHRSFDQPIYDWLVRQYSPGSPFTQLNEAFTELGDPLPSIRQTVAATAVFVLLFGKRFWIPLIVLPLGLVVEFGLQGVLADVIGKGRPPYGLGTYFSGGSARFVVMYGLTLLLILVRWPRITRPWRIAGVAVVALLAFIEGFTRLYLLLHWPTDIPAGWLMGTLITLTIALATRALLPPAAVATPAGRAAHLPRPRG